MRWILVFALAQAACTTPVPFDTDDSDTGTEDTDVPELIQWVDRTIETSATLNAVYTGGRGAFVVGDDGLAWRITEGNADAVVTNVRSRLMGVWGDGDGGTVDLTAAGYAGSVLNWNGESYDKVESDALGTTNFEDIDGEPGDLTAVSATGIHRLSEGAWSFESNGFNHALRSLYVGSGGKAVAVGELGVVLVREGDVWSELANSSRKGLVDVHGSKDEIWMVGARGTVLRLEGGTVIEVESPTTVNLHGVWVASSGRVYVVGNNGASFMWDPDMPPADDDTDPTPGGWEQLATGAQSNLYAVHGSDEENIWAVGNRGAVYRYLGPKE
ncbi:MAG: hypothetical protein ACI9MC_000510 [Kiritimatiellia bacterium]|jgi:hypothetical protein